MTVKQLINCLKELPQDAMVVEYAPPEQGYIGGYNRVQTFKFLKLEDKPIKITLNNLGEYQGKWICHYAKSPSELKEKLKEELDGGKLGIIISCTDYIIEND